jgi:hypothetical protein
MSLSLKDRDRSQIPVLSASVSFSVKSMYLSLSLDHSLVLACIHAFMSVSGVLCLVWGRYVFGCKNFWLHV